jgi:hypothetical protein
MKNLAWLTVVMSFVFIFACSKNNDGDSTDPGVFYTAAKNTAPTVAPASATSALRSGEVSSLVPPIFNTLSDWSGTTGYRIFYTIRDFDPTRDQGKVDGSNMYMALYSNGVTYNMLKSQLDSITEKTIASPFDFGNTAFSDNYNSAKTGLSGGNCTNCTSNMAARTVDNDHHMLYTSASNSDGTTGYGVTQAKYNDDSKDLEMNMAYIVNYGSGPNSGSQYGVRTWIKGNAGTHSFSIRYMIFNGTGTTYNNYSIVGRGISKGTGNFLFYAKTSNSDLPSGGYFCFDASADEAVFQSKFQSSPTGETIDTSSPCYTYKSDLDVLIADMWNPGAFTADNLPGANTVSLSF